MPCWQQQRLVSGFRKQARRRRLRFIEKNNEAMPVLVYLFANLIGEAVFSTFRYHFPPSPLQ
jgi:hypothetical protein